MKTKTKKENRKDLIIVGVIFLAIAFIAFAVGGKGQRETSSGTKGITPQWQIDQDEEIAYQTKNGTIDSYVRTRFIYTLRPDSKNLMRDSSGHLYNYEDLYSYISKKLGYECTQLSPYSDTTPQNQMAECHKK